MLELADARKLVGVTDSSQDARLQQLIDAAYEQAARYVGPLAPITVTETVDVRCGRAVLSRRPVQSITGVVGLTDVTALTVDQATGAVTGLPGNGNGWGWDGWAGRATQAIVTYVAGFDTVPASVEEGVRAWVRHRYLQEAYGSATYGGDAQAAAVTDFDGLPNAVRNAWGPYMIDDLGWGIA